MMETRPEAPVGTDVVAALAQGALGGAIVGLPVGGILAVLQPDTEAWALLLGFVVGPPLGFVFGLIGALAVIAAARMAPRQTMASARRRDRLWGGTAMLSAGVVVGILWMSQIDLEGGRRLYEVVVLAMAPVICGLIWSFVVGLPHLRPVSDGPAR